MEAFPYISKRFALERFLGLTEEEIQKNETLWREENETEVIDDPKGSDLRSIGVSVGDIETDENTIDQMENPPDEDMSQSPEVAGPVAGPTPGGAGVAPAGVPAGTV